MEFAKHISSDFGPSGRDLTLSGTYPCYGFSPEEYSDNILLVLFPTYIHSKWHLISSLDLKKKKNK